MIDFVKDLQETKAEEALKNYNSSSKSGKKSQPLGRRNGWRFARSIAKQSGGAIGRSERFANSKTKWNRNSYIPLCRGIKSNATRNALHDKITISLEVLTIKMAQPYTLTPKNQFWCRQCQVTKSTTRNNKSRKCNSKWTRWRWRTSSYNKHQSTAPRPTCGL